jgi:hypothetical protein
MNRKRFAKLLMSIGYDRNEANTKAFWTRLQHCQYEKMWRKCELDHSMKLSIEALGNGIIGVGKAAKKTAEALSEFCVFLRKQERSGKNGEA